MSHPSFLELQTITCFKTDDLTGSDVIFGIMGDLRFEIGEFDSGMSRNVNLTLPIVQGVTKLTIMERDATGNDELIAIDLTQEMDVDRVVEISWRPSSLRRAIQSHG